MSSFCSLFQIAIDYNRLIYSHLPENTLSNRLKKAKLVAGLTQKELSLKTGIPYNTINSLECGVRGDMQLKTLLKLIKALDKDILCDDYLLFVLNQKEYIEKLLKIYGITKLCKILNWHHSKIYRLKNMKHQISRKDYDILKKIKS